MATASRPDWPPRFCLVFSFSLVVLILLFPQSVASPVPQRVGGLRGNWQNANNSWAYGIVVPDGAKLQGGGVVRWSTVTNLTALFVLPNITKPDGIIYVVLSAMGSDKSVFQVAAGTWTRCANWSVYSWFIKGVDSRAPSYQWMANSTGPKFSPNDELSISIFVGSNSTWIFRVVDVNTGSSVERAYPKNSAVSFASGDQEVFSLESYSHSISTFKSMGNLTLESLLIDGSKVLDGWYSYSGWDPFHNPLFAVGGSNVPAFIYLTANSRGLVFGYTPEWMDAHLNVSQTTVEVGVALFGLVLISSVTIHYARRPK